VPWAVELSGEHPALARAEARAVAARAGGRAVDADLDRVLLVEGVHPSALAARAALARRVVDARARAAPTVDAVVDAADAVPLDGERFAVRCTRLTEDAGPELARRIERELGEALAERGTVDLDAPERVVRVLVDREAVVGLDRARVDRSAYEDRHVEARPHFSPVSLHPRLARTLVNLAHVGPGDRVWDPFAGTGGIALEAALVGARVTASDLDPEMAEGTRAALSAFDVDGTVLEGDVAEVGEGLATVDAVVTDPPYGRASSTDREALGDLYERFFAAAERGLPTAARLVCVLPDPAAAERAPAGLTVVERHAWYVHASLTRHVLAFRSER
jgi:tRNA (guanine10-N2)-dimethyltransferase